MRFRCCRRCLSTDFIDWPADSLTDGFRPTASTTILW